MIKNTGKTGHLYMKERWLINWDWLTLCRSEPGKAVWRCCQSWILKDKFYKQTKVDKGRRKDIAKRSTC